MHLNEEIQRKYPTLHGNGLCTQSLLCLFLQPLMHTWKMLYPSDTNLLNTIVHCCTLHYLYARSLSEAKKIWQLPSVSFQYLVFLQIGLLFLLLIDSYVDLNISVVFVTETAFLRDLALVRSIKVLLFTHCLCFFPCFHAFVQDYVPVLCLVILAGILLHRFSLRNLLCVLLLKGIIIVDQTPLSFRRPVH